MRKFLTRLIGIFVLLSVAGVGGFYVLEAMRNPHPVPSGGAGPQGPPNRIQEFLSSVRGGPLASLRGSAPEAVEAPVARFAEGPTESELASFAGLSTTTRETLRLHFNLGLIHAQKGETEASIAEFRQVIQPDAQGPYARRAYINLGLLYDRLGRTEEAVGILRRATTLEPENPVAHHVLGLAFLHGGRGGEAIATLARAAELDPTSAEILQNLTVALFRAGDIHGAENAARRAVEVDPDRGVLPLNLGLILWKKEDLPGAAEALAAARGRLAGGEAVSAALYAGRVEFARGKFDDAARFFGEAAAGDPARSEAHFNLGVARAKSGDGWSAADAFRKVLSLDPDDTEAWFNLGVAQFQTGDMEGALGAYQSGLTRDERVPSAHFLVGYLHLRLGRADEAETHFRRVVELGGPEAPRAHVNLGLLHEARGDLAGAIDEYRQGDPEDATTFYNLGLALRKRGDHASSAESLKRARALAPADKKIAAALGDVLLDAGHLEEAAAAYRDALGTLDDASVYLRMGHIERRLGHTESADSNLTVGIAAAREAQVRAQLLVERAVLFDELGKSSEAYRDLADAVVSDPANAEIYHNLGVLTEKMGETDRAVEALQTAIRLSQNDPRPFIALGNIYYRRGLLDEARELYEKAARADSAAIAAKWRLSEIAHAETAPVSPRPGR